MYTVLIMNRRTTECFYRHYPLFLEAMSDKQMAVCRWMEAGTTIDTAVPALRALTDDKPEWRAVIVRVDDEETMSGFDCDPLVPFDFYVNAKGAGPGENPVPLVRLAQMLGGVPDITPVFEPEDTGGADGVVFHPKHDESSENTRDTLSKKYDFDGRHPTELLLVTLRDRQESPEDHIDCIWKERSTEWRKDFWRRNRYPSICRFIVFDMEKNGPVQRTADLFRLWTAILLLIVNNIESSALQGYGLYRMDVEIDGGKMGAVLQQATDQMVRARFCMDRDEAREQREMGSVRSVLPDYTVEIKAEPELPADSRISISPAAFGLVSNEIGEELVKWRKLSDGVESEAEQAVRVTNRTLEQTAAGGRMRSIFPKSKVSQMTAYEEEDLNSELDELYTKMLTQQGTLPDKQSGYAERMDKAGLAVEDELRVRVTQKRLRVCIAVCIVLVCIAVLPAVIMSFVTDGSIWIPAVAIGLIAVAALLFWLTGRIALTVQKRRLSDAIRDYNAVAKELMSGLQETAEAFSEYLTGLTSLTRGWSYLKTVRQFDLLTDNSGIARRRHRRTIDKMMEMLDVWSVAFGIRLRHGDVEIDDSAYFDTKCAPEENRLYSLEYGKCYRAPLGESGICVDTPVCFAAGMELIREELCDDRERTA